jgi:hypothetical protein
VKAARNLAERALGEEPKPKNLPVAVSETHARAADRDSYVHTELTCGFSERICVKRDENGSPLDAAQLVDQTILRNTVEPSQKRL